MKPQRIKKFLSYYKPYQRLFYADMVCALMVSIITLALPFCVRYITKNLIETNAVHALSDIYFMGGVMLALLVIYTICEAFVSYQGHIMGALMEGDMRHELFDHYQKLSFNFYDEHRTGELMTRISNDSLDISELYHHGPEDVVISVMNFMGAFVILTCINVKLALMALSFLPIMGLYGYYFSNKMQVALRKTRNQIGHINVQVEDSLSGIRVVKSFTNEAVEQKKFLQVNQDFINSRKDGYKSESYFYSGLETLTHLMMIAVVVFGAVSIVKKTLDLGDLLAFLLYMGILIEPIKRLGNFVRLYQEGLTGFQRFMEILEIEPDIKDAPDATQLMNVQGHIEFKNVTFQYPKNVHRVLDRLSIRIKAGEYVALVGPSGVGKTTLCSLIPRFYEATEGDILVDGQSIQRVTQKSLRDSIGVVQQDTYLFSGSVLENIRYGRVNACYDEIVMAAKQANAHDFIMALPQGYDTDIGQRGVKLSGGQKQRLSIARVFLKNPPIIIFDEATSSLDSESEKAVQKALEALAENRTTIVIAHRLSTLLCTDRILVLDQGRVVEDGTHNELLTNGGLYRRLWEAQVGGFLEDQPEQQEKAAQDRQSKTDLFSHGRSQLLNLNEGDK